MEKCFKNGNMKIKIDQISYYTPSRSVDNQEIENLINQNEELIPYGTLIRVFGIENRFFADKDEMASDLAVKAAMPIVNNKGADSIDYLIFASACSDLIEPATCNIVQYKLGLKCPAVDIKNACNSFVSAITHASSLIECGIYKNIIIVNGEKLSDAIQFNPSNTENLKKHFAAYSLGDAGVAMLLTASNATEKSSIEYQSSYTNGNHWNLCTIKGGGSMFPHDASKNYFEGHTSELHQVIGKEGGTFFHNSMKQSGWQMEDINAVFTHQVSMSTFNLISDITEFPITKIHKIFPNHGNTAAASIPLSMAIAIEQGKLKRGDKIAIIGLAAGINLSLQLLIF